jgi:hypothetical protein
MRVRVDVQKTCKILDKNRWPLESQVNFRIYLGATGTKMVRKLGPHMYWGKILKKTSTKNQKITHLSEKSLHCFQNDLASIQRNIDFQ